MYFLQVITNIFFLCNKFHEVYTINHYLTNIYSDSTTKERYIGQISSNNYSHIGFTRTRAPLSLTSRLEQFWTLNYDYSKAKLNSTYLLSVDNGNLYYDLRKNIWNVAHNALNRWINDEYVECKPASLYGIKVYQRNGTMMSLHLDALPFIFTVLIHVASDLSIDWPLVVHAKDHKIYNLTMQPGDLVIYEGHSVPHGHPFPLQGRYYANIYAHFEPLGYSIRHERLYNTKTTRDAHEINPGESYYRRRNMILHNSSIERKLDDIPPFITLGTLEERRWKQKEQYNMLKEINDEPNTTGIHLTHTAASLGDYETFEKLARSHDTMSFYAMDSNGWQPIHEAARAGHIEIVEFLLKHRVDYNSRTNNGKGGTALWWANQMHGKNHPVTKKLKEVGALDISPEA